MANYFFNKMKRNYATQIILVLHSGFVSFNVFSNGRVKFVGNPKIAHLF
jgi:hypothetical protein